VSSQLVSSRGLAKCVAREQRQHCCCMDNRCIVAPVTT
jgi:hypothetical protein